MTVLVAPDSFKGTLSAAEVAAAVAAGVRAAGNEAVELPLADGGEGTMEVLVARLGGELRTARAEGPLGRPLDARFALLDDGATAIVETAEASGLTLVAEHERDAVAASTRGTGQLICAAAEAGATRILVAVGGSATTDGGRGAVEALHEAGVHVALEVICDVSVPWEHAAPVFAPQKGAGPEQVAALAQRLDGLAARAPRDPRGRAMTGAAGGLAGGLWAHFDAVLRPGASFVLDALGFDRLAREADAVVTGEGRIDAQTRHDKLVSVVAARSRAAGAPCHAVVGQNALDDEEAAAIGLASITEAGTPEALVRAGEAIARRARAPQAR